MRRVNDYFLSHLSYMRNQYRVGLTPDFDHLWCEEKSIVRRTENYHLACPEVVNLDLNGAEKEYVGYFPYHVSDSCITYSGGFVLALVQHVYDLITTGEILDLYRPDVTVPDLLKKLSVHTYIDDFQYDDVGDFDVFITKGKMYRPAQSIDVETWLEYAIFSNAMARLRYSVTAPDDVPVESSSADVSLPENPYEMVSLKCEAIERIVRRLGEWEKLTLKQHGLQEHSLKTFLDNKTHINGKGFYYPFLQHGIHVINANIVTMSANTDYEDLINGFDLSCVQCAYKPHTGPSSPDAFIFTDGFHEAIVNKTFRSIKPIDENMKHRIAKYEARGYKFIQP